MYKFQAPDDDSSQNRSCYPMVPNSVSHRLLICALADESRLDIPREQEYLFPLLHDLLDKHWMIEPPSDEERSQVLDFLASSGH